MKKYILISFFIIMAGACGFIDITENNLNSSSEESISSAKKTVLPTKQEIMTITINEVPIQVEWEDNDSVSALKELVKNEALTIQMSIYGGFEQVGSIGTTLPRNDIEITTSAGDIVLYRGDQIVIFYGSNTWEYTRLGKIIDKTEQETVELLAKENVEAVIFNK